MARPSSGKPNPSGINLPSAQELARALSRNYEARTNPSVARRTGPTRPVNASVDQLTAATMLMDTSQVKSPLVGPLAGLSPADAALSRDFSDVEDGDWADYYAFDDRGFDYENLSKKAYDESTPVGRARRLGLQNTTTEPAEISIAPTTTKYPERPRTVAAGYDVERKVLTVVFRDGTYYNYYKVSESEWEGFVRNYSKGEYIKKFLDGKPRGTANMGGVIPTSREELYRINRTAQWISDGLSQFDRRSPRIDPTRQRKRK